MQVQKVIWGMKKARSEQADLQAYKKSDFEKRESTNRKSKQTTAKRDPKKQTHTQRARRENDQARVATSLGSLGPKTPTLY